MKSLRSTLPVTATLGAMFLLSSVSFGEQSRAPKQERHQAKIKLLQDSATALQVSHPELAKRLKECVDEESKEPKEQKEGMEAHKELEGATEKQAEGRHQTHLKLLRASAAALQASRPDLAADLTKMADHQAKQIREEQKEDSKEKGEKNE